MSNEELKKKIKDLLYSSDEECVELAESIILTYFPKDWNENKSSKLHILCEGIMLYFSVFSSQYVSRELLAKMILKNFNDLLKYNETNC